MSIKLRTSHKTAKLSEIIDSDLLTATERYIRSEIGGFYAITDEQAFYKTSSERASVTFSEFERMLKAIHKNFFLIFEPAVLEEHRVGGHRIGFFVDEYDGFVPICAVGRSGDNILPANSRGKIVQYKGQKFKNSGIWDEEAILTRGYVAAFEACKQFIISIQEKGISPLRCIGVNEFFAGKKMLAGIGGATTLHNVYSKATSEANVEIRIKTEENKQLEAEKEAIKELTEKEQTKEIEVNHDLEPTAITNTNSTEGGNTGQ